MTARHRVSTSILVALGLAASAGPALARPFDLNANGSYVPWGSASMHPQTTEPAGSPAIVHITAANGFDWGDAGIGAAGGFALSMIAVGGALAVSQNRTRRTTA